MNNELLKEIQNILNNDFDRTSIIKTLTSSFEESKELIISTNSIDQQNGGDKFEFETFIDLLQHYFSKDYLYHNELETVNYEGHIAKKIYVSKGICGLTIQNNNLYAVVEILLSNLLCHNITILNLESDRNYGTIKIIADIINVVIYNLLGIKAIIIITRERYEQFENTNDNYDFMIFVGNNKFLKSRIYDCTIPYIYYCYNDYKIIYSNEEHLSLIDKQLLDNDNVNLYKYDNIKEIVKNLNSNYNYCCAVLTNNTDDLSYFANNVKSKFVFLNSFPFIQRNLEIELNDLLDIKIVFK